MKYKVLGMAVVSFLALSCASKKVAETSKPIETTKEIVLNDDQRHGKMLYEQNCAKCHVLHKPSKHDAEGWKITLAKMQKKAKISDEETASIYNYLTAGLQ